MVPARNSSSDKGDAMLTTRPLLWTCCFVGCLAAFGARPGSTYAQAPAETLELLRTKAADNEKAARLIKLKYSVKYERPGPAKPAPPPPGQFRAVREFWTHMEGVWAQDGPSLQYSDRDSYVASSDRPAGGEINVLNGNVAKQLMKRSPQGGITDSSKFMWNVNIDVGHLGIRPFEGKRLLSEVLAPDLARVRPGTEEVDGHTAFVVDVKRPADPPYYGRMWIDAERGMPLKIHHFSGPPGEDGSQLIATVESIKLHRLPGGGWLPVSGSRRVIFREGPIVTERIAVDVATITTRREDIPASLFDLVFPEGTKVRDARGDKGKK
jgi:hypothetical protein